MHQNSYSLIYKREANNVYLSRYVSIAHHLAHHHLLMKKRVLAFIATTIVSAVMAYLWKSLQDKITNAINNMFEEVEV
jgi:hypothetical protein